MADLGTWIGVGVGVAALALAWLSYRSHRDRKRIEYVVTTKAGLLPGNVRHEVEVVHLDSGVSINKPWLTIVRIVNTGDRAITANDFETKLSINLVGVRRILSATVTATRPADLEPELGFNGASIDIDPLLVNPGDAFQVQLLSDGEPSEVSITGRVADLEIVELRGLPYPPGSGDEGEMISFDKFIWWVLTPALIIVSGVVLGPLTDQSDAAKIAILGAAVLVAVVLYPMQVRYLVNRRRRWNFEQ
jgi:hypothetical protein